MGAAPRKPRGGKTQAGCLYCMNPHALKQDRHPRVLRSDAESFAAVVPTRYTLVLYLVQYFQQQDLLIGMASSSSSSSSAGLTATSLFCCGHNGYGQLGLGDYDDGRNTFTAVPPLPDGKVAKQVLAGKYHTMILAEDGTVFTCGGNGKGELGLGDNDRRNTFTAVPPLPDGKVAKQVVAG